MAILVIMPRRLCTKFFILCNWEIFGKLSCLCRSSGDLLLWFVWHNCFFYNSNKNFSHVICHAVTVTFISSLCCTSTRLRGLASFSFASHVASDHFDVFIMSCHLVLFRFFTDFHCYATSCWFNCCTHFPLLEQKVSSFEVCLLST